MDNQQPSISSESVQTLARNAVFGDGTLWKHPECKNYKGIWTSTTPELLEVKRLLCLNVFQSGVAFVDTSKQKGRFANAKPLYRLASIVHPTFTAHKLLPKEELFQVLTIRDFGLWYLDDGCCIKRSDSNSYRYVLSIGDCACTNEKQNLFEQMLRRLFGSAFGRICLNNSRATVNNKSWVIPLPIAAAITAEAAVYGVLPNKFPRDEGSTTRANARRTPGLRSSKRNPDQNVG